MSIEPIRSEDVESPRSLERAIAKRALELAFRTQHESIRAMHREVSAGELKAVAIERWWPRLLHLSLGQQANLAGELGISLSTLQAAIARANRRSRHAASVA